MITEKIDTFEHRKYKLPLGKTNKKHFSSKDKWQMWENANNSYATKRDNVPNIKETLEMSKKQSTSRNMGRDYK